MNSKDNKTDVYFFDDKEIQQVYNYWTPERIKNAQPDPASILTDQEFQDLINKQNTKQQQELENLPLIETPFPVDVNQMPYDCGGRIFYTNQDGIDMYGSAQFVGHCHMLLTAAHCVRDFKTGNYYTNFLFHHKYDKGSSTPIAIKRVKTPEKYLDTKDRAYDYAFCYTVEKSNAFMQLQIGIPHADIHAIGYPITYENGKVMHAVNGKKGSITGGIVQMLGNSMTEGCSGGAWIVKLSHEPRRPGGEMINLVVGLNSFRFVSDTNNTYSPLFNLETIDLFNLVLDAINLPDDEARCQ